MRSVTDTNTILWQDDVIDWFQCTFQLERLNGHELLQTPDIVPFWPFSKPPHMKIVFRTEMGSQKVEVDFILMNSEQNGFDADNPKFFSQTAYSVCLESECTSKWVYTL